MRKHLRCAHPRFWLEIRATCEGWVNKVELARKLGVRETVVRRMLHPDHATKAEKIQIALETLGKRFLVVVEDAA